MKFHNEHLLTTVFCFIKIMMNVFPSYYATYPNFANAPFNGFCLNFYSSTVSKVIIFRCAYLFSFKNNRNIIKQKSIDNLNNPKNKNILLQYRFRNIRFLFSNSPQQYLLISTYDVEILIRFYNIIEYFFKEYYCKMYHCFVKPINCTYEQCNLKIKHTRSVYGKHNNLNRSQP